MPDSFLTRLRGVAHLARLQLEPERETQLAQDLEHILAAFQVLEAADLEDDALPPPPLVPLRTDEPAGSLGADAVLAAAPERIEDFFGVPKTIGDEA